MSDDLVFHIRLPLELAPTLNEYANMRSWKRAKIAKSVDAEIWGAISLYPSARARFREVAKMHGGKPRVTRVDGERRRVQVTRESSRRIDEVTVDVIGGKIPIDRLVAIGILVGDSAKWLDREPRWLPAHPKAGALSISVFRVG